MSIYKKTKRIIFITLTMFILGQGFAYAAEEVCLDDPTTLRDESNCGDLGDGREDLKGLAVRIVEWIRNIPLVLSVLMIVVAGFMYLTAAGSKRYETAGKMIQGVLLGILVIFMASSLINEVLVAVGLDSQMEEGMKEEIGGDGQPRRLSEVVGDITSLLAGIISSLGILMLIVGGIMYMTAAGNDERMKTAKNIVNYSIMGIAISLLAWSIVAFFVDLLT